MMKIAWCGWSWAKHGRPSHGPQVWPWWKLLSFNVVELRCYDQSHLGRRVWIYTRWDALASFHWDYHNEADMLWQRLLDRHDAFRHSVFTGKIKRVDFR